jgi:5-methyltetrahydrofolate--homocysteine methyltransferase
MKVERMDLLATLKERTVILDGAMGTELMARGFASQTCPEEWNVSHPDVVADVHRGYFAAGADIVLTNTLGGTRAKLAHHGLDGRVAELNAAAAGLASAVRDADAPGGLVAGDIGPTGRFLKPMGDLTSDEMRDMFAEQAAALVDGGADVLIVETMFDLAEACHAVEGARSVTKVPVMASMTFGMTPRGYRTMMGIDPKRAVVGLLEAGADIVGSNCSLGADQMVELVAEFRAATDAPILAEPNAGQPRLEGEETVYDETAKHFAAVMPLLVAQGAALVGGCCGTTPEYIAALVRALRK